MPRDPGIDAGVCPERSSAMVVGSSPLDDPSADAPAVRSPCRRGVAVSTGIPRAGSGSVARVWDAAERPLNVPGVADAPGRDVTIDLHARHHADLGVLGPLRVVASDREVPITRPGYRRTLSWLLFDAGRSVDRDVLIERLWPDDVPETARNTLQHYVSGLRKVIGRDRIRTVDGGYAIDLAGTRVDVTEFTTLAEGAHRASRDGYVERAVSLSDSALALWRGRPFQDIAETDEVTVEIRRLERLRQQIDEIRLAALIDMGSPELAIPDIESLVLAHPLREQLWELLMLARYRIGEQAEALRAFREAKRLLADRVGLDPGPGLTLLEQQILLQDPALTDTVATRRTNLPPAESPLVGRTTDVDALTSLVAAGPVVTITGSPGMGKTHLATEVARSMLDEFEDGVWLVSLRAGASLFDVIRAVSEGVGTDAGGDFDALTTHLRHLNALIVLDNAEHVAEACRRIMASSLRGAQGLHFLATSRSPIGISSETVWRLRGLETHLNDGEALSPAAELLTKRIQMIEPTFRISAANTPKLNDIAARTDGVPLAMVLIASWLPAVGLDEVPDVIHSRSGTPNGDGPTTIEDALDWSYRILPPNDVDCFDSLAIFTASFDLDAAWAVAGPHLDRGRMIGVMARLVEASLLETIRSDDGALRYRLLIPIRDHALGRLEASDRYGDVIEAYTDTYRRRALEFAARGAGPSGVLLGPVDLDIADHRAAMRMALDRDRPEVAADIAASLTDYWFARFLADEGRRWLRSAADHPDSAPTPFHSWAAGFLAYLDDDRAAAEAHYVESLEAARSAGDDAATARSLFGLGRARLFGTAREDGARHIEEAIGLWGDDPATLRLRTEAHLLLGMRAVRLGAEQDPHLTAAAELLDGVVDAGLASSLARYRSLAAWNRDEADVARDLAQTAVAHARRAGDAPKLCGALSQLTLALHAGSDPSGAGRAMLEALDLVADRDIVDLAQVLSGCIGLLIASGHREEAAGVVAILDRSYERVGLDAPEDDLAMVAGWRKELVGVEDADRGVPGLVERVRAALLEITAA